MIRGGTARFGLGATLLALTGCEDAEVVTRVEQRPAYSKSVLTTSAAGGFPAEVHGRPFPALSPDDAAALLRLPGGFPQDVGFRAVAPGRRHATHRLVFVFNGAGVVDGERDCELTGPAETEAPQETGFSVTATLCSGDRMLATGHLEAPAAEAGDRETLTRAMTSLFQVMFREDPDR